ncbi:hypothetical protein DYB32_000224 [Aphanomyces invadans]|uniref:Uncharacterized protein n=1 Tax=Aphanomyces invadans TaxID=157072 RepID=A0A3R6W4W3_9STRA|nr:hypothetical protein DYB32_000224 [Aphanomyces invadans]
MPLIALQRCALRRLANAGVFTLPHSQHSGRSLAARHDFLTFSTSGMHNDEAKHEKTPHGDDKTMMDKVKETVHAGVDKVKWVRLLKTLYKTQEQIEKVKEKTHDQYEKMKVKTHDQFEKVRTAWRAALVRLKDYEENTNEMGADYYERIRDSLDKWNESLMDLESKASNFSGSFGKDVSDYVKEQRHRHAELTRKAKARKNK